VTLNWHWPLTAIAAPVSEMLFGAVVVNVPPQTLEVALATVNPTGSVSVNATPLSGSALTAGLVIVNVSDVVAPVEMVLGVKLFAIDGGTTTCSCAVLLVAPVPPSVELTGPVVLF
jgi:hypothetical protein